ncbi:hypothetical protein BV20DRAFT_607908 [Pilatotrama ljubarskyi]|nr:hypothetical protein BV20DRAFT_607908 [Pilatotrama ljubarskyi]
MLGLPSEIWREIFAYACTDGGHTGSSLALCCRFFYNASLTVRFQSLSFFSLRQIELFLVYTRCYELQYQGRRPRVYHLLLSFTTPSCPNISPESSADSSCIDYGNDVDRWITARKQREQDKAQWDHDFLKLVPGLLQYSAPHLRTLAILQTDGFTLPAIKCVLPRLRELTLLVGISVMLNGDDIFGAGSGSRASPSLGSTVRDAPAPTPTALNLPCARFPALERLHLICGRHRDFVLRDTLAHLPHLAPALTHLRISNATYMHEHCIPGFLRAALGLSSPDYEFVSVAAAPSPWHAQRPPRGEEDADVDSDSEVRPALPGLRRVIVHSVPPPQGGVCGNSYKEYVTLTGAVHAISAACEGRTDVRILSVRSERARQHVWEQLVEGHWVNRIEGGPGCWLRCDDA